jgi:hypothetical protein
MIIELNISMGTDPACVSHKMGLTTGWLSYRMAAATPFLVQLLAPVGDREEYMMAVRVNFQSTRDLDDIRNLSDMLRQDCIAVYDPLTKQGHLIGARALAWGVFDIKKFTRIT